MVSINKIIFTAPQRVIQPKTVRGMTPAPRYLNNGCAILAEQKKVLVKKTGLDKNSKYCKFFGADSPENVQNQLENQIALSWFKRKEQGIVKFPSYSIDTTEEIAENQKIMAKCINKLKEKHIGRWTFMSDIFPNNGEKGTHTVGMVYDKDTLWIIDSLSDIGAKTYNKQLRQLLEPHVKTVKFSAKPQQNIDEYSCNNWTHANLDSIIKYKKENKSAELTEKILDKILPTDINSVLKEQHDYLTSKLNSQEFFDIVAKEKYGI